jgi:hypothetical protein
VLANRVVIGPLGAALAAAACGGATQASKSEPGAAGSAVVVAGASSIAGGMTESASGGGLGGGGGSGGDAAISGDAGQAGEPSRPDGAGIVPEALEGCRGPSDAGCDVCYWAWDEGRACTRESGGGASYLEYEPLDGPCPADGARCARCSYENERSLRGLGERGECGCPQGTPDGSTRVCEPDSASCGCYCNALGELGRACPRLDN